MSPPPDAEAEQAAPPLKVAKTCDDAVGDAKKGSTRAEGTSGYSRAEDYWNVVGPCDRLDSARFDPDVWSPADSVGHFSSVARALGDIVATSDHRIHVRVLTNFFRLIFHHNISLLADCLSILLPHPKLMVKTKTLESALACTLAQPSSSVARAIKNDDFSGLRRRQAQLGKPPPLSVRTVSDQLERLKEVGDEDSRQHTTPAQKLKLLLSLFSGATGSLEMRCLARLVKGKRAVPPLCHNLLLRALAYTFVMTPRRGRVADSYVDGLIAGIGSTLDHSVRRHVEGHAVVELYKRMDAMNKVIRKAFAHCQSYAGVIEALFSGCDETDLFESITQNFPPSELCSIVVSQFSQPTSQGGNDSVTLEEVRRWVTAYFMEEDCGTLEKIQEYVNRCAAERRVPCSPLAADDFRDVIRGLEQEDKLLVSEEGEVYLLC